MSDECTRRSTVGYWLVLLMMYGRWIFFLMRGGSMMTMKTERF